MLTIRPKPCSSMYGTTSWVTLKTLCRLTSMTAFQSACCILARLRSRVMPALLTRKSILPNRSATAAMAGWTSSGTATLPLTAIAWTPRRSSSSTADWAASVLPEYPTATLAPCRPSSRAMARPMPRPPPVTRPLFPSSTPGMRTSAQRVRSFVRSLVRALKDGGDAHATANAQRRQPVACVSPGELVQQLHGEHRAARADRMPERDRAAHRVQLVLGDAQLAADRHGNRGKRFVDFEHVDVVEAEPGALQRLARRGQHAHAHVRRIDPRDRVGHQPAGHRQAACVCRAAAGDQHEGRAVVDAAGVARGH